MRGPTCCLVYLCIKTYAAKGTEPSCIASDWIRVLPERVAKQFADATMEASNSRYLLDHDRLRSLTTVADLLL